MVCSSCSGPLNEHFHCYECASSRFEEDQHRAWFNQSLDQKQCPTLWSKLRKLNSVPITFHYSWWLVLFFFGGLYLSQDPSLQNALRFSLELSIIYGSLLLHEFSHVFAAHRFGIHVKRVVFHFAGAAAELSGSTPSPKAEFLVSLAGPLCNFMLAFIFSLLFLIIPNYFLYVAVAANVIMAVFNLLPIYPMDGGRLLRAFLWARYEAAKCSDAMVRATALTMTLSRTLMWWLIFISIFFGLFWIAAVLWFVGSNHTAELAFLENYTKKPY